MIQKFKKVVGRKLDNHTKEVARKASSSTVVKAMGMVVGLLVSTYLGRVLGAHGLGIINLTTQITTIIITLVLLGTPQLLVKELSIARIQENWKRVGDLMKSAFLLNGITALAVSTILMMLTPFLVKYIFRDEAIIVPMLIALAVIIFQVLSRVMASGLIAYRQVWQSNLVNETLSVLIVGLLLILSWAFNQKISVITGAIYYAIGRIFVTLFVSSIWKRLYTQKESFTNVVQPLLKNSLPFLLVSATGIISSNIDSVMIGALSNVREVGVYSVAARLALLNIFFLQVVNSSLSPKLATLYAERKIKEMNLMVQRVTAGLLIVTVLPLLLFFILGKPILSLWGEEFASGYWILLILSIGQIFNIGTGSAGLILIMCGEEKVQAKISLTSVIIKVVLNLILIRIYGALGAAIGTAIAVAYENVTKMIYAKKRVGVMTLPISLFRKP